MSKSFEELYRDLGGRLAEYEVIVSQGIVPGSLDTYEMEQIIGRIKELNAIRDIIRKHYVIS